MNDTPKAVVPFAQMAGYRRSKSGLLLPGTCALHGGIGFNCQCCDEESSSSGSSSSADESSTGSFSSSVSESSSSSSQESSSSTFWPPGVDCTKCISGTVPMHFKVTIEEMGDNYTHCDNCVGFEGEYLLTQYEHGLDFCAWTVQFPSPCGDGDTCFVVQVIDGYLTLGISLTNSPHVIAFPLTHWPITTPVNCDTLSKSYSGEFRDYVYCYWRKLSVEALWG